MKRQLSDEEKKMSRIGIRNQEKSLTDIKGQLSYNRAYKKFLRDFDDEWRFYLRSVEEEQDNKTLKAMKQEIEKVENTISITKKQMNEGVDTSIK